MISALSFRHAKPRTQHRHRESAPSVDPSLSGLYTIRSSDGSDLTRITSNLGGQDIPIDYSPNGEQIVFGRRDPNRSSKVDSALFVVNVVVTAIGIRFTTK